MKEAVSNRKVHIMPQLANEIFFIKNTKFIFLHAPFCSVSRYLTHMYKLLVGHSIIYHVP